MNRNSEDHNRGCKDGAKPQSASAIGAQIFTAPIQSPDYREGFKEGQRDHAKDEA